MFTFQDADNRVVDLLQEVLLYYTFKSKLVLALDLFDCNLEEM
jgi:hypothetical protein